LTKRPPIASWGMQLRAMLLYVWFYHAPPLLGFAMALGHGMHALVHHQSPQSGLYCYCYTRDGHWLLALALAGHGAQGTRDMAPTGAHPLQKGGPRHWAVGAIGEGGHSPSTRAVRQTTSPLLAAPAHEGTERRGKWESQLQPDGRSSSKETKHNKAASQQERRVGNGLLNWLAILCSSAVNCALGSGVGWVLYEKHNWVPFLEQSVLSFSQVRSATIQHQLT
jgi:hypothetical protein